MPRKASATPLRQDRHHGGQRAADQKCRRRHGKRGERKARNTQRDGAGGEQASDMR